MALSKARLKTTTLKRQTKETSARTERPSRISDGGIQGSFQNGHNVF